MARHETLHGRSCARQSGIGALALQFTILTAARSGEVRGMAWYEVDFEHNRGPSLANA